MDASTAPDNDPETQPEPDAQAEAETTAQPQPQLDSDAPSSPDAAPTAPQDEADVTESPAGAEPPAVQPAPAEAPEAPAAEPTTDDQPAETAQPAEGTDTAAEQPPKRKKGKKDEGGPSAEKKQAEKKPKKPAGPEPAEVIRKIGATNEAALRYVASPDPQLSRLSRKVREELITEVPPVTAGALLGPEALARHFIASAASGRYRDLFSLWDLFRTRPEAVKPVLAERQRALERARQALTTAAKLGLRGHAENVAADIERAEGLIWTWLREVLESELQAIGRRPVVVAALARRDPTLKPPLPEQPTDDWLAEAAALKATPEGAPEDVDRLLSAHIERLPATVATLTLVAESFPNRVAQLMERVDLGSPEIVAILAWARDHGVAEQLRERITADVAAATERSRAEGLATWQRWQERGVNVPMPPSLREPTLEGLDLTRPESATLIATLVGEGADIRPQAVVDDVTDSNRQAAEKVYEAFVCAGLDVHLPLKLEGNPIVKEGTRCPACQAWTWVRPGHEKRCPRLRADQQAAAEAALPQASSPAQDQASSPAQDQASSPAQDQAASPAAAAEPGEQP